MCLAFVLPAAAFFHNDPSEPRLIDNADIFEDHEEEWIAKLLKNLKDDYQFDFVVLTDNSSYGKTKALYSADYYDDNGYGVGDNYSGVIMFICMDPEDRGWWTARTGDAEKYFTESNVNHLDDIMYPYMVDGEYAEGVYRYFSNLGVLIKNGKFPLEPKEYIGAALISLLVALPIAFGFLISAESSMSIVKNQSGSSDYLEAGSLNILESNDVFINKTVSRTYISSDSGSRSGGSSYSGGYHSSGGHSFSGGGRSF